jgi:hypothetical protein
VRRTVTLFSKDIRVLTFENECQGVSLGQVLQVLVPQVGVRYLYGVLYAGLGYLHVVPDLGSQVSLHPFAYHPLCSDKNSPSQGHLCLNST